MLAPEDRRAIDGLFQRLDAVEREAREPRDPDAEALIARRIAQQPAAPYYMAQTVIVQQRALEEAEARINELERQLQRGRSLAPREPAQARHAGEGQGPWARSAGPGFGGGFLAGAMQTALGVTGGILLGHALGGMFSGGDSAQAAESADGGTDAQDGDAGDAGDMDVADSGFDAGGDMDFGDF